MKAEWYIARKMHIPPGDAGGWVTYMPTLCRALMYASGGLVLELGAGPASTPFLFGLSGFGFEIHSYEESPSWYEKVREIVGPDVHDVPASIYRFLTQGPCPPEILIKTGADVVFVDNTVEGRARDLALLAQNPNVRLIVVHDWNIDVYGYDKIMPLFQWRVEDRSLVPNTAILSNTVDLSDWSGYVV